MRITVLFDNFGPYHLARLSAAAKVCDLSAIELHAKSHEYQWQREDRATEFARQTLFQSQHERGGGPLAAARRVAQAVEQTKPDVVAIPGWSGWYAFAALNWCSTHRVPAVVMSESTADDERRAGWKEWIKRRYLGMCGAALVGGERHRDYLVQLRMPADRIVYGYDAVDNGYFARRAAEVRCDAAAWRGRLALPERYFLASARFVPKKNHENLLRAYADYRAACRTGGVAHRAVAWDLVLLGDGAGRTQLEELRQQLGMVESVHLPGFKQYEELPPYYGLASAFIHPSTTEQWGLVVNEALAAGLPVLISNRCGCALTIVREGENGMTFDPHDVPAMASAMLTMTRATDEARQAMGRRGSEIVAGFGPDRFAEGLHRSASIALAARPTRHSSWDGLLLRSLLLSSARST